MRRVFDAHVHYPANGLLGLPFSKKEKNHKVELERIVEECEKNNVVKTCLLGGLDGVNDMVLDACRAYPHLFIPMAYLNLDRELPECVDNYYSSGFKGFKIIAAQNNYDNEKYFAFYEKIQARKMVVLFHTGVLGGITDYLTADPRKVSEEEAAFEKVLASFKTSSARQRSIYLDTIGMSFPDLKVIGAHLGYGEYDLSCAVARWRRNVYFDISGGDVVRRHLIERKYIGVEISPNKLLFGSDCVTERIGEEIKIWIDLLETIGLGDEEIDRVMYSNGAYLFD
jgi:uncharacterized protein